MPDRRSHGPRNDNRFALHQAQPRADKLDGRQRDLCRADNAFQEALRGRVSSPERFAAFLDGSAFYIDWEKPCGRCGNYKRRVRNRSCYACHLRRTAENFHRMRAGLIPDAKQSRDGRLDVLERQRREKAGEHEAATFGTIKVRRCPTGRLEVTFPDGFVEPDLGKTGGEHVHRLIGMLPELKDALLWAGWF